MTETKNGTGTETVDAAMLKPAALLKAEKRITIAAFAGVALALLTVLQFIFPFNAGLSPAVVASGLVQAVSEGRGNTDVTVVGLSPFIAFSSLFFIIVAAATFGVYKKNKISAVVLFCYAVIAFVFSLSTATGLAIISIVVLVIVLLFLFYGILGTFDYRQILDKGAGRNAARR